MSIVVAFLFGVIGGLVSWLLLQWGTEPLVVACLAFLLGRYAYAVELEVRATETEDNG